MGKPLLALGMGGGCVIAASYEAKAKGVKTGMRVTEAKKLCPDATALPSDFTDACRASEQIESILRNECPLIEKYSVDEWFLDVRSCVGGTPKNLETWAQVIQHNVHKMVGLTVSVGIGPTKLIAKMASEYRKPAGMTIVHHPEKNVRFSSAFVTLESFLRDRTVLAIPGIGKRRGAHADAKNWRTAWDFVNAEKSTIVHLFGKPGGELQTELSGISLSGIDTDPRPPKSISRARSFKKTSDVNYIFGLLMQHVAYCVLRMRTKNLSCSHVSVWLRDGEYHGKHDVRRLPQMFDNEEQLLPYIRSCFGHVHEIGQSYTQVGLCLSGLTTTAPLQYSLFETPEQENELEKIQEALDTIRTRYGRGAVTRGSGITVESKKRSEPDIYGNAAIVR